MEEYINGSMSYFPKCIALSKNAASFEVKMKAYDGEMNVVINKKGKVIVHHRNIRREEEELRKLIKDVIEECAEVAKIIFGWSDTDKVTLKKLILEE